MEGCAVPRGKESGRRSSAHLECTCSWGRPQRSRSCISSNLHSLRNLSSVERELELNTYLSLLKQNHREEKVRLILLYMYKLLPPYMPLLLCNVIVY